MGHDDYHVRDGQRGTVHGGLGPSIEGTWAFSLKEFYGDVDQFRICPSAKKASETGYGNTTEFWGWKEEDKSEGYFRKGDYGSYGINHWINSLPSSFQNGWRGQPSWHWSKTSSVDQPVATPVFGDCAWYGGNPFDSESGQTQGRPPTKRDWNKTNPKSWGWDMGRFCMDRHNRAVNFVFVDGSARSTKLASLWNLEWHREFRRTVSVDLGW